MKAESQYVKTMERVSMELSRAMDLMLILSEILGEEGQLSKYEAIAYCAFRLVGEQRDEIGRTARLIMNGGYDIGLDINA